MMKRLLFFGAITVSLTFVSQSFAQVRLESRLVQLEGIPGKKITESIAVENTSDMEITLKAYTQDFTYAAPFDGTKQVLPASSHPRSCADWITVTPMVFKLTPHSMQKVQYTIAVPEEAKGGYWAALFFERKVSVALPSDGKKVSAGVGLSLSMGCSIIVETPEKDKTARIENLSIYEKNIKGDFLNLGNVILATSGTFDIINEKGKVLERGKVKKLYLPPGEKAPFTVNLPEKTPQGNHTLVINFDLGEGDLLLKEVDFAKDETKGLKILQVRD